MFTQLNTQRSAPLPDKNAGKIDEREFVNPPFSSLFPQGKFVVIDWLASSTTEFFTRIETWYSRHIYYNIEVYAPIFHIN